MKSDNHMISYMTSHVMDFTRSGQFHIITYFKDDLSLIIHYLTYLTFLINLHNQPFKSTFTINLFNQSTLN